MTKYLAKIIGAFMLASMGFQVWAAETAPSIQQAEKFLRSGNRESAQRIVEAFLQKNDTAIGYIRVGNLYARVKKWAEAVHYLEIATKRDPRNAFAFYELGITQHQNKKTDDATLSLRKSLGISSKTLKTYQALAEILELAGSRQDARNTLSDALKKTGDSALVRKGLCRLFFLDSFFRESLKHCRRAYELDPKDVTSAVLYARTQYDNQQRKESFASLDTLTAKFPRTSFAFRARGILYYQEKSYEQALQDLGVAFGLAPRDEEAGAHLARTEFALGHYEQALPVYVEVVKLDRRFRFELASKQRELTRKNQPSLAALYQKAVDRL